MAESPGGYSARSYLLAWIITPLVLIIAADTYFLYRSALRSVSTAYDRTLLATAHAVGDSVRYEKGEFRLSLPLALFEIYEADQSGRYFYRVSNASGNLISGDEDLPFHQGSLSKKTTYPAVVQFYEDSFRAQPIRVAVLYQPVSSNDDSGTVIIQVAEPLKIRQDSAQGILRDTLLRQTLLLVIASLAIFISVTRALKPLYQLRVELDQRSVDDLSALTLRPTMRELGTVTHALNELMQRVGRLVSYQKRFIANASHQLRTPLAVLKTQLQSGIRGDSPAPEVLLEMAATVERTIALANQMLLLAKIEQRRTRGLAEVCHLGRLAREAALELSPLIAEKSLDFEINDCAAQIRGDAWLVGELIRNLLNNAIEHTASGQKLGIEVSSGNNGIELLVWDSGEGLPEEQVDQLFEPFSSRFSNRGSGLGLAISKEIAISLNGTISLNNRIEQGAIVGLDARVIFAAD
jgi:two-component system sensor histidine kinase TctE